MIQIAWRFIIVIIVLGFENFLYEGQIILFFQEALAQTSHMNAVKFVYLFSMRGTSNLKIAFEIITTLSVKSSSALCFVG